LSGRPMFKLRRNGDRQDQGRRHTDPALHRTRLPRHRGGERDQGGPDGGAQARPSQFAHFNGRH
jgi:hypothetical protein